MTIQAAILPHKHVRFCDSIIALAGYVRKLLAEPRTIDELWATLDRPNSGWPTRPKFVQLVFAIDVLYAIKQIDITPTGRLRVISNNEAT